VNLYNGCSHACRYCYAPDATHKDRAEFHANISPRADVLKKLEAQAPKFAAEHPGELVLLSFSSDPYQPAEAAHQVTQGALKILLAAGLRVALLTKAGDLGLRDLPMLAASPLRHWFGVTLTTTTRARAEMWEPGAELPVVRMRALNEALHAGLRTWVSLEPVIYPQDTIGIIHHLAGRARHFAVGKLNHWSLAQVRALDPEADPVDWPRFRAAAIAALEQHGYRRAPVNLPDQPGLTYYIKKDLEQAR
jgi:DNA repair photolyase